MARGGGLVCKGGGLLIPDIQSQDRIPANWTALNSEHVEGSDRIQILVSPIKFGCYLRVEFSIDETNWYQYSRSTYSGSDKIFIPADFKIENTLPITIDLPVWAKYIRISTKRI